MLRDPAGYRRFRLIVIYGGITQNNKAHVEKTIRDDLEQLWAEAIHRYRQREPYWIDDPELDQAASERASRSRHVSTIEDQINHGGCDQWAGRTLIDICLAIGCGDSEITAHGTHITRHPTAAEQHQVSEALRSLGMTSRQRKIGGKNTRVWDIL